MRKAADTATSRILYVPSNTLPFAATVARSPVPHADYIGTLAPVEVETMQGVPIWKPLYGRITAIDLNTGDHRWVVPMGGLPPLGRAARGHVLLTKTLLIIGQESTTRRERRQSACGIYRVVPALTQAACITWPGVQVGACEH